MLFSHFFIGDDFVLLLLQAVYGTIHGFFGCILIITDDRTVPKHHCQAMKCNLQRIKHLFFQEITCINHVRYAMI